MALLNHHIIKEFFILLFLFSSFFVSSQLTCTQSKWPSEASSGFTDYNSFDATTNSGYLMEAANYHVPDTCQCGVLYKWIFVPQDSGDIQFQVWHHANSSNYYLKGENYLNIQSSFIGQQMEFYVPIKDRITIRSGYLIGWYAPGSGIIGYKDGDEGYSDEARQKPVSDLDPALQPPLDWTSSDSTVFANKIYAFGAETYPNNAPEFENLPTEVWIYPTTSKGTFVYHITYDDIDSDDKASLFVTDTTEDPTSFFYYDRTTDNVYVTTNPQPGTYTMTFKVQDQCLNSNTGELTIQVLNWAPSITNLPGFAVIPETTDKVVELFTIQISDRDNATLNEVAVLNVVPSSGSSNVDFRSHGLNDANRTLISVDGAIYDYNTTQQYIMDITLTDETSQTGQGYFILYITKNDPPKFTNLNNRAYTNVSYKSTAIGDTVYIVSAIDSDHDPLTYSMSCTPVGCPLEMTSTEGAGVISATADFVRTYVTGWDIEITVTDGFTTVGPKILTVLVQEIKDKPRFVNLPLSHGIGVHENTPLGTTVYTVQYIDIDTNDNNTITATFDPTWANNYFQMNSTSGALTTEFNVIDFEEVTDHSIVVAIRVSDDYDWSDETLTIHIRNVNEAPSFHQTMYTLEPPEEGAIGASAGDWRPIVNDPDTYVASTNEEHTFTWDCGSLTRHFIMDSSDGSLTYSTTFDYDKVNFTTPYDCVVTVTDNAGLSASTILQISITDLNDNAPVFALTTDYYVFQVPTLDPGRFVGQVTATDADRTSLNSDIYYSWHTYPTTLLKDFIVINKYGNIYVNETWIEPLFDYGVSYELVVLAENIDAYNNGRMTATATVTLFLSGTTTTTELVTDRPLEFIEDNKNVAWVSVATGLLSVILVMSCAFIVIYTVQVKRYRWCMPWCRKRLLGVKKMTDREKRRYYRALLKEEELEELSDSDSDKTEMCDYGVESDDEHVAPPMMWDRLQLKGKTNSRGPTVRKASSVPQPALYEEPKPPLKSQSRMM